MGIDQISTTDSKRKSPKKKHKQTNKKKDRNERRWPRKPSRKNVNIKNSIWNRNRNEMKFGYCYWETKENLIRTKKNMKEWEMDFSKWSRNQNCDAEKDGNDFRSTLRFCW